MVKNGRFLNTDLHRRRRNMNYKLDKEYIVKRFRPLPLPILYYRRPFYLSRTSFARGRMVAKKDKNRYFFH